MDTARQIRTINEIRRLEAEVAALRSARAAALTGAQSASVGAGNGSRSYTNWSPDQLDNAIADDLRDIEALKRQLAGQPVLALRHAMQWRS